MLPAQLGTYYQAVVPDALDLAERARLSLNHLTSVIREELDYEMCWVGVFDRSAAPQRPAATGHDAHASRGRKQTLNDYSKAWRDDEDLSLYRRNQP